MGGPFRSHKTPVCSRSCFMTADANIKVQINKINWKEVLTCETLYWKEEDSQTVLVTTCLLTLLTCILSCTLYRVHPPF